MAILFLLCLNAVLNWPEDCRSQPKHVAKYNLIVIIASCIDVCYVLTVHNISYKSMIFVLSLLPDTISYSIVFPGI